MRRVVSIWLPTWPTDRLRRHGGAPPADRLLVTAAHDGRRRVIAAADRAAWALGLRAGLTVAQARAMVPDLTVVAAEPEADAAALRALAAWCLRVSPLTAADPPDGIWIDLTGCAHLHGGEAAVLDRLLGALRRDGIGARGAIAGAPGAAHALARHGAAGAAVVPPGSDAAAVAPLPVGSLRLPAETVAALRRLRIETVGALLAAPRAPLARRFGATLLRQLDRATGRVFEPIVPVLSGTVIEHRIVFAEPLLTAEALAAAITQLAERVCTALERTGLGARRLELAFERIDGGTQAMRVGTALPSRAARHLARLLDEHLGEVDPGHGVEAMRLTVTLAEPLAARQAEAALAASSPAAAQPAEIAALVDRLANRLGAARLYRLAPVESDVPERSCRQVPALAPPCGATWPPALPRPGRLLDPPQPVAAMAALPDEAPRVFTWRRVRRRVRRADGPERIHGEWWRRDAETWAVRDYWQIEDEDGQRYWLFRRGGGVDLATGNLDWFLHGLF